MSTISSRVAGARGRLERAGVPPTEAALDARLLAQHALGWDTARFLADARDPEPVGFAGRYEALVSRRSKREPLAYITGRKDFWNLELEVSPAVLIPRPETELIVEAALALRRDTSQPFAIADVGTGSGCLAIALASERPLAAVIATDLSGDALRIARANAERLGVGGRIQFLEVELLAGCDRRFDLIVSNPPYVPERDFDGLQPEVRDHEPRLALSAGPDGLSVIRRLVAQAVERLNADGVLVFEFGFGQSDAVRALVSDTSGLTLVKIQTDLQGIPRVAVVRSGQSPR